MTSRQFTILIADRNPHVRELLKRELTDSGYRIHLAKTAQEVVDVAFRSEPPDLLILDPDLPDNGRLSPLRKLKECAPALPLVLHLHSPDTTAGLEGLLVCGIIEKTGNSIENVKKTVAELFNRRNTSENPPGHRGLAPGPG
ncbi:MAG: response regulator [Thermodesulfobacteriota bacterium]